MAIPQLESKRRRLRRGLAALLCLAGSAQFSVADATAADWMFQPSYYSHADSPGYVLGVAPQSRSAYRPAYAGGHLRGAIRGGQRYNNIIMQNGNSFDRTLIREGWFDINY